jgi:hypothetical protein
MDRDKTVSAIIIKFSELKSEFNELFSEERIIEKADLMIEEFFESKFNPLINRMIKEITALPHDDYTLIAIDTWIKDLHKKHIANENLNAFAEVRYIHEKYIPKLIVELKNIKLKILEDHFNTESPTAKSPHVLLKNYRKQALSANALAFLFSQLHNFNVIPNSDSLDGSIKLYCELVGIEYNNFFELLTLEDESLRLSASASVEELQILSKVLRSILSRTESQIHNSR